MRAQASAPRRRGIPIHTPAPHWRTALAGAMLAGLLAACGGGGGSDTTTPAPVVVPATALPSEVNISLPGAPTVGEATAFGVTLAEGLSATWDFGDGSTATGASTSHAWAAPGSYDVKLTVTNADGAARTFMRSVNLGRWNLVQGLVCTGGGTQGWCVQRAKPTANAMADRHFIDATRGWAVGAAGQILTTTDGGATWRGQASGSTAQLTQVRFADASHGWATGDASTTLRTSDGGTTWRAQNTGETSNNTGHRRLVVADANRAVLHAITGTTRYTVDGGETWQAAAASPAVVAGDGSFWNRSDNTMSRSTDFGTSYQVAFTPGVPNAVLQKMEFGSGAHAWGYGFAPYFSGDGSYQFPGNLMVWTTADGGSNWQRHSAPAGLTPNVLISAMTLLPDGSGYAINAANEFFRTANGGANWQRIGLPGGIAFTAGYTPQLIMGNASSVVLRSQAGAYHLSLDSGATWRALAVPAEATEGRTPTAVDFTGGNQPWVNHDGRWYRGINGSDTWQRSLGADAAEVGSEFSAGWLFDANRLLAASASGWRISSTDAGQNWSRQSITDRTYTTQRARMQFVDGSQGWLLLHGGNLWRSSDGGQGWTALQAPTRPTAVSDFQFADASLGWALQGNGAVLRTTDGGATWATAATLGFDARAVRFSGPSLGVAVGEYGQAATTGDGGATWRLRATGSTESLRRVVFAPNGQVWALGLKGTLLRSADGGASWTKVALPTVEDLHDLAFANASTGWVVGANGTALATSDGGNTWLPQTTQTKAALHSVLVQDARTAWLLGGDGLVLATATGGQ